MTIAPQPAPEQVYWGVDGFDLIPAVVAAELGQG